MACKVVFHDHAEHLVSQTPRVLQQHLWMEVLSPWWLHYDEPAAAALNACRSPGQRHAFPPHPGAGRGRWACFLVSLIVIMDISWAYTF